MLIVSPIVTDCISLANWALPLEWFNSVSAQLSKPITYMSYVFSRDLSLIICK
ncbi:hypothetical protein HMPREF0495_01009 [Levilactobacillus brevis ATCC 14869 = DSM 20054]|uniref:Uncharacterized protein n=1 Tax=Levilactobacillus brevis ATCC 14869 = DSM 20054 TaxID=649758 RepID=U2P1M8_LEVBR|nr:hypothetical protein HMPREF0495_01009 [Levilactobacillus brevis ATCC 14869 = DSM 20054]